VSARRRELADDYAVALQHFLSEPEEPALARAHELGRQALTDGLGVLDMEIQERVAALGGVLRLGSHTPRGTDLTVEIPLER